MKDVMILTGAGQIGMAIARRMGYDKKIIIGDKNFENAKKISEVMNNAGFDVEAIEMDISSRKSILNLISEAQKYGEIAMLVNAAGVSPSQASIESRFIWNSCIIRRGREGHKKRWCWSYNFKPIWSPYACS